jgi:hypothetical protein
VSDELSRSMLGAVLGLKSPSVTERLAALSLFSDMGQAATPYLYAVAEALEDSEPAVRAAATDTIYEFGKPAAFLLEKIRSLALEDDAEQVRASAERCATRIEQLAGVSGPSRRPAPASSASAPNEEPEALALERDRDLHEAVTLRRLRGVVVALALAFVAIYCHKVLGLF